MIATRLLLFCLVAACLIGAALARAPSFVDLTTEQDVQSFCEKLARNSLLPIRCIHESQERAIAERVRQVIQAAGPNVALNPVVLVPGLCGSGLQAKIHKESKPAWYCFENWNWFRIWLPLTELIVQSCWFNNLQILYNAETNTYSNTEGVEIRPDDFGGLEGVNYISYILGFGFKLASVYAQLSDALEQVGYQAGVNLVGAPYDWRLPGPALVSNGWYSQLQTLIETTYAANGNMPVFLVSHSMGGPTTLYFLNNMTSAWKSKYIRGFISLAGPWSGSAKALRGLLSGDDFGMQIGNTTLVNVLAFRDSLRQSGGIAELFPDAHFWPEDFPFVRTNTTSYSAQQFSQLFDDAGAPITAAVTASVRDFIHRLQPPHVPTWCMYGTGVPTEISYYYPSGNFNDTPAVDYSNGGDGVVPLESLQQCQVWTARQSMPVEVLEYTLRDHWSVLSDPQVVADIVAIATQPPLSWQKTETRRMGNVHTQLQSAAEEIMTTMQKK